MTALGQFRPQRGEKRIVRMGIVDPAVERAHPDTALPVAAKAPDRALPAVAHPRDAGTPARRVDQVQPVHRGDPYPAAGILAKIPDIVVRKGVLRVVAPAEPPDTLPVETAGSSGDRPDPQAAPFVLITGGYLAPVIQNPFGTSIGTDPPQPVLPRPCDQTARPFPAQDRDLRLLSGQHGQQGDAPVRRGENPVAESDPKGIPLGTEGGPRDVDSLEHEPAGRHRPDIVAQDGSPRGDINQIRPVAAQRPHGVGRSQILRRSPVIADQSVGRAQPDGPAPVLADRGDGARGQRLQRTDLDELGGRGSEGAAEQGPGKQKYTVTFQKTVHDNKG